MGNLEIKNRLILESSLPGTLYLLLEDESEVEEAQEFSKSALKAIQTRLTKINSLVGSLPSGGYRSGLESLVNKSVGDKVKDLIEKTKNLTDPSESLEKSAKEVGVLANEIDEASKDINTTIKINLALMRYMASQILKSNLHKGEDKDIPMEEILKEGKLLETALKELGQAFDTAFKGLPGSKKGFFAKLGDKLFGSEEPVTEKLKENKDSLVKSILELTPIEIAKFAQSIVNYGKEDDKETKKIEDEATEMAEEIANEAGSSDDQKPAGNDEKKDDSPKPISKKDLIDKVRKNPMLGDGGAIVLDKIIGTGLFDDLGIKLSESLRKRNMSALLSEAKLDAEEYQAAFDLAIEVEPEKFKDMDADEVASELNSVFAEENIDVQIEVPASDTGAEKDADVDLEEEVDEAAEDLEKEQPEIASVIDDAVKEDKDLEKEVILRIIRPIDISSLPGDSEFKDQAADQQRQLEEFVVEFFKAIKKAGLKAAGGKKNSLSQEQITKYAKAFAQYTELRDNLLMKHQTSVDGKFRYPNPWANPTAAAKGMIGSIAAALEALDEEAEDAVNKAISDNSWTRLKTEAVKRETYFTRLQKLAGIL